MKTRLALFLLVPLIAGVVSFGFSQNVFAGPYGSSAYGACTYQDQAGCSSSGSTTTGAPDTGQQSLSLVWPAIAGFIGFLLVSFVVIRYLNRNRAQTK